MDAAAILATPLGRARTVMGQDRPAVRRAFKDMASRWHPDACPDPQAARVFAHIVALRDAALAAVGAIPSGATTGRPTKILAFKDGRRLGVRPLAVHAAGAAEALVAARTLTFVFGADAADLGRAALARWVAIRHADARMEQAMGPLLPPRTPVLEGPLEDGGYALAMPRLPGFVALPDLLARLGGRMDPVHAAWLGSGLFHLAAWLGWAGLAHGAIQPETVFVDPATHRVALWGGWEHATALGSRPSALPQATIRALPRLGARGEVVDATTDRVLVRDVLRAALGEAAHLRPKAADVPAPLADRIAALPPATAVEDYQAWITALEAAWGPRRFRDLGVVEADVYGG